MKYEEVLKPFRQHRDFMEDYIKQGIENNRKHFFRIRVYDKTGKPLRGVRVHFNQTQNEFRFGANCFMLDEFECNEKNEIYRNRFKDVFDMATLPIYWNALEPEQGKPRFDKNSPRVYRRPATDLCLEFCEQNNIKPKAHCLVYDAFTPDWVPNNLREIKKLYEKRCALLAERYADRIDDWEVINETLCWGKTVLAEQPDMVEWAFDLAKKYFPHNKLIINEANGLWGLFHYNRSAYYMQIERALGKGSRIDGVGLQWHMMMPMESIFSDQTPTYYNPMWIEKNMKLYASFGKPVQITEVTIPSYSDDPVDEEIQAEIIHNLYSMWFASPQTEAIIYWNLNDGYAAYGAAGDFTRGENQYRGGLIRFDGTPKKAYYTVKDLKASWRSEADVVTDEEGLCSFKGFYGDYNVTLSRGDGVVNNEKVSFLREGADSARFVV